MSARHVPAPVARRARPHAEEDAPAPGQGECPPPVHGPMRQAARVRTNCNGRGHPASTDPTDVRSLRSAVAEGQRPRLRETGVVQPVTRQPWHLPQSPNRPVARCPAMPSLSTQAGRRIAPVAAHWHALLVSAAATCLGTPITLRRSRPIPTCGIVTQQGPFLHRLARNGCKDVTPAFHSQLPVSEAFHALRF